jgi:transcriptional regulator with XRE-family HTH domain
MTTGQRIAAARKKLGMTQDNVTRALEVSSAQMSKWERGEQMPSCGNIAALAKILHVSADYLLGLD